jgi:hypothetical protein
MFYYMPSIQVTYHGNVCMSINIQQIRGEEKNQMWPNLFVKFLTKSVVTDKIWPISEIKHDQISQFSPNFTEI